MACGIGVCMTCVLPVRGDDGRSRFVRSCVEGPVFDAGRVRWDDVGQLPADLVGADAMGVATEMADLTTRLGPLTLPNPVLTASGCAAAGRELHQFFDVARSARSSPSRSWRGRGRGGRRRGWPRRPAACSTRSACRGRASTRFIEHDLAWLAEHGARTVVSIAGGAHRRVRRAGPQARAATRPWRCSRSTSPARTSRTAARCSPATRSRRRG